MTMRRGFRAVQHGLSLLELLVAFAIMAMALGLLYRSMGSSARNVAEMVYQQQAAMVAESLLSSRESVAADGWNESGESAGFAWQVRSTPYVRSAGPASLSASSTSLNVTRLHQVVITLNWMDGSRPQKWELQTLLPQRKPDPGEVAQ